MKKLLFFLLLAILSVEVTSTLASDVQVNNRSLAHEEYVLAGIVDDCRLFQKEHTADWVKNHITYAGVFRKGNNLYYYLPYGGLGEGVYCKIRRNNYRTFQDVDVSKYQWMAEIGNTKAFFNYRPINR